MPDITCRQCHFEWCVQPSMRGAMTACPECGTRVKVPSRRNSPIEIHDPATRTLLNVVLWGGFGFIVLAILLTFLLGLFQSAARLPP